MKAFVLIYFLFFILLVNVNSVIISEIHSNPEGSDSGHEWIEIYNDGSDIDLADWKFFEDDINHRLTLISSDYVLKSHGYAIIAEKAENFSRDYPRFSGQLFDSAWSSLRNDGEFIALKDGEEGIVDGITYPEVIEGKSLCRDLETSEFFNCDPSPGVGEAREETNEEIEEEVVPSVKEELDESGDVGRGVEEEPERSDILEPQQQTTKNPLISPTKIISKTPGIKLITFGTGYFNDFIRLGIRAENIESLFIHIEDSNGKKISHTSTFEIKEGLLDLEFNQFVFSSCDQGFQEPFFAVAYFGSESVREPTGFEEEDCNLERDERNLDELFSESELAGDISSLENGFIKFFGNIGDWFSSLFYF